MRRLFMLLLVAVLLLAACSSDSNDLIFEDLPTGDAGRGETLFSQSIDEAPACSTCHRTDDVQQTGPGLGNLGQKGGERVEGESAEEYAFNSIVRPVRYLVTGFSNVMYSDYAEKLSPQDIADLIAYLLTL